MQQFTEGIMPLSRKQRRFIVRSDAKVNLSEGSIRSSKTYAQFIRWATFIADDVPNKGALVVVGKTMQSIYRNLFEPLDNDPALGTFRPMITYRQGAPTAHMFGRTVHIIGAADAKAESKIRGFTVAGALVDELTTIPEDAFKQLLGRMSPAGSKLFATTNPDGPQHWLKKGYLDRLGELSDWYVEHFTMSDNPSLTDEYKTFIRSQYQGVFFDRFIRGLWVAAEGAIYPMFEQSRHVISPVELPEIDTVLSLGVDYGANHPTRGYLIGIGNDEISGEATLYVLSEFAPETATVGQHAAMMREWLASQPVAAWRTPDWIAIDPAALVFRQQMFADGGVEGSSIMRAHNNVLGGIETLQSLLALDRIKIVNTCTHLIKGLPGYVWDSSAGAIKSGAAKPVKMNDDEVDALRYAIYSVRRFWRDRITIMPASREDDRESEDDGVRDRAA